MASKLNLTKTKTEKIKHGLFSGIELSQNHDIYQFTLNSLDKSFSYKVQALDQNQICTGISCVNDQNLIKTLENENVFLSDTYENRDLCLYENTPDEIHLLLGADVAAHLFTQNMRYLPNLGISAFQTRLGWVMMGKSKSSRVNKNENDTISTLSLSLHVSSCNLADMWSLDTLGISNEENKSKLALEKETLDYFLKTIKRDETGRFEVSLPWVVDKAILPNNRSIAENCVYKTEKKLIASKNKKEYSEIFDSWESNEIIEEVWAEKKDQVHYLPHRPVIKESSTTTKIRPVFNASAHMKNAPSLNDCLTKGPNLIEIIPRILNRFRKYRIGISSDIEKAFLQIKITEKDRDFLRFFWFDETNKLKIYRHCRVVFGLTSSPFLLVATLKYLLSEVSPDLKETAQMLEDSFYLDNSLISLDSKEGTQKFIDESISILTAHHFNLRCWKSNYPIIVSEETENDSKDTPVLGLIWELENDNLKCKIDKNFEIEEPPYTKRKILSLVQKIFDPIGFTTPVVLTPKLILQQTWMQKLTWDGKLPESLEKQFEMWIKDVGLLAEIKIPRWLNIDLKNEKRVTLHVFSQGCNFEKLKMSKWWEGPSWLYLHENAWPHAKEPPDEDLVNSEKRKTVLTLLDENGKLKEDNMKFKEQLKLLEEQLSFEKEKSSEINKETLLKIPAKPITNMATKTNSSKDTKKSDNKEIGMKPKITRVASKTETKETGKSFKAASKNEHQRKVKLSGVLRNKQKLLSTLFAMYGIVILIFHVVFGKQDFKELSRLQESLSEKLKVSERKCSSQEAVITDLERKLSIFQSKASAIEMYRTNLESAKVELEKKLQHKESQIKYLNNELKQASEKYGKPDLEDFIEIIEAMKTKAHNDKSALKKALKFLKGQSKEKEKTYQKLLEEASEKEKIQQLSVGDIVLLEDTTGKRINWPLAKIIELLPGKDGVNRLARIQTQTGTFLRPVQRLFPLEISSACLTEVHPNVELLETPTATEINIPPRDYTPTPEPAPPVTTRSGRIVKKPQRFPT